MHPIELNSSPYYTGIYTSGSCDSLPPTPVAIETEIAPEKGFYIYLSPGQDYDKEHYRTCR